MFSITGIMLSISSSVIKSGELFSAPAEITRQFAERAMAIKAEKKRFFIITDTSAELSFYINII